MDEFICKYCGRSFSSTKGLFSHLRTCEWRRLETSYVTGGYVFTVIWNPVRKVGRALNAMARGDNARDFDVVVKFLKLCGIIDDYKIDEVQGETASPSAQAGP